MAASRNKFKKIGSISHTLFKDTVRLKTIINNVYNDVMIARSPIKTRRSIDIIGRDAKVILEHFPSVDGNVTIDELVFICALARKNDAKRIVEIGTFDGNTALQLALNTSDESRIHTLDLPVGADDPKEVDVHDVKYIESGLRIDRRFLGTTIEDKVTQHYGNSLEYDFAKFCVNGQPDYIFVDAGHSYECVRNDSEKSLEILETGGMIVWQDYTTAWPGVYNYLVELSEKIPLIHILGTTLVIYKN